MRKYIIGISAFYHDSSVCLFRNDNLVFACEEERFSGIKHDSSFPTNGLKYIIEEYDIKPSEIEMVCYYENPEIKLKRVKKNIKENFLHNPKYCWESYVKIKKNIKVLSQKLSEISKNIFYSEHHLSHLYYSFYTSSFNQATCISIDGVGEFDTTTYGVFNKDQGETEHYSISQYPHSLGLYYSAMTAFLGFKPNEGEYKVMGLASYGDPYKYLEKVSRLISFRNGRIECNMKAFIWNRSNTSMFGSELQQILDLNPRFPNEEIKQEHRDLAAAVQKKYEEILNEIIYHVYLFRNNFLNENENLCLGGGCAYNGTANGKITKSTQFKHLWIPPAPSDAGSSVGACIHYIHLRNKMSRQPTPTPKITMNPFLGPSYDNYDIRMEFSKRNVTKTKYLHEEKLLSDVAKLLVKGKIIGWYQGHMEFGARALGNRSILADPRFKDTKDRINKVVKRRESFRPFAPMVIKEKQSEFFEMTDDIPYMNQVVKVKYEYMSRLQAVTHVDGTARVQTVYSNTLMHKLLLEFEKLTGLPILLNTSFNIKDKTIVLTPKDALDMFYDSEMDYLVMDNYIIYKEHENSTMDSKENREL